MRLSLRSAGERFAAFFVLVFLAAGRLVAQDPTLIDSVPKNGEANVSLTAPIVFTFSEPMNTAATEATFAVFSFPFPTVLTDFDYTWNVAGDVLTCTPTKPLPKSTTVIWTVSGEDLDANPLDGGFGQFMTGSGGGGGGTGSGTNHFTIFSVTRAQAYIQTVAGAPTLDPDTPYLFSANLTLASNRTATVADVKFPTPPGTLATLTRSFLAAEDFYYVHGDSSLPAFDASHPPGTYTFTVHSDATVSVPVTLPSGGQPNAPHVANFTALQTANPTQPITIQWDKFTGGTVADAIQVQVGNENSSPDFGEAGALNGTATSWVIPAGTLQASTTYETTITFVRINAATNVANVYVTSAGRGTYTAFSLITGKTTAPPTGPITIGPPVPLSGNRVAFTVTAPANQSLVIESKDALLPGTWSTLLTTDNPTGTVRYTNAVPAGLNTRFYRSRSGP